MARIGFHASHERSPPSEFLRLWLGAFLEPSFEELQLDRADGSQRGFIEAFGTRVLPQLRR